MKKYQKKFVELKDETIAYLDEGKKDGKMLFLIHGNMSGSLHWTPLIERLEDTYHIIAPDMKGYGDSTYNIPFNHLDQQADLMAEFCEKLGLKHLAVAGWSTGGGVAMSMKARYPELVDSIIFVDSISYRGHPYYKRDEKGLPIMGAAYSSMEEMAADRSQKVAIDATANKDYARMEAIWNLVIYTGNGHYEGEESHYYITETFKQRCMMEAYWALSTFNISDTPTPYAPGNGLVHKVTCPILMFWGENDIAISWDCYTKDNVEYFPPTQLKFIKLPHSGHSPLHDQPDLLAKGIREFLK